MITAEQMRQLEFKAVQEGVSLETLMENAGKGVFEAIKEKYNTENKQIVVFCGPGNNGGDGFVAARYFHEAGNFVTILFFGDKWGLSEEARLNYNLIKDKVNIISIVSKEDLQCFHFQKDLQFILIDALLGTGIKGELRELMGLAIDCFNSISGIKVAVDVPSGLNPDTGAGEKFCQADLIVCLHDIKQGLEKLKRKCVVVGIGIVE